LAQELPWGTTAAQEPHAVAPAVEQSPLWHCASVMQVPPAASEPVSKLQGPDVSFRTEQPLDRMVATHASSELALRLTPGKASAAAHRVSNRPWMRASSVAGGGTIPLQEVL
jgi:hypothetical protein